MSKGWLKFFMWLGFGIYVALMSGIMLFYLTAMEPKPGFEIFDRIWAFVVFFGTGWIAVDIARAIERFDPMDKENRT